MKWCCPPFEEWFNNSDRTGFGIVVDQGVDGSRGFALQCRAIDRGVNLTETGGVPVQTVARVRIAICPSCGRSLGRFYRKTIGSLPVAEQILEDPGAATT
jgi:hypothetical protein